MKKYQLVCNIDISEMDSGTILQFEKDIRKRLDSVIKAHFPIVDEVWIEEFEED